MNEQRVQAYVSLIEKLLSCGEGEEIALLQQHADLVDAGLLAVMQQYADWLEQQGQPNAGWLRQFAQGLAAALSSGNAQPEQGLEDAVQFLLQVLRLIVESQDDAQQVYPFLAQHQDRLNEALLQALPQFATKLLSGSIEQPKEQQEYIAAVFVVFGDLLQQFPLGQRGLNLELAITAYQQALAVRTRETMPVEWATSMNNLATAYVDRIRGDRAQNIEAAISGYESSLEIFSPKLFPHDCRRTARSLGNLLSDQTYWQEAVDSYRKALQAAENLYQSATLLDSRTSELLETADLPRRAAYALARTGDLQTAVLVMEQGRARSLSETLDRDRSNLIQLQTDHNDLYEQYQGIINQLRNLETQQRLRMTSEDRHDITPEALRSLAQNLHQSLKETIDRIRQVPGYKGFLAQPSFEDICKSLQPNNPLIYIVPTPAGSLALILTPDHIADIWLDELTDATLIDLLNNTWFKAYAQSQTNHQAWLDAIDQSTRQLWQPLMAPLIDYLKERNFQQAVLIPTGHLNLLPLHAAWTEDPSTSTGQRYALDEVNFTYAPNARSLEAAQAIAAQTGVESILAIDNPLKDLPNSNREVNAAIATFQNYTILPQDQATAASVLAALPHHPVLHLSCHGTANFTEPLLSGLAMSDGLLTLRDILDLKLAEAETGGIRLAVLSACETGIAGIELADEIISLPTGLLRRALLASLPPYGQSLTSAP